MSSVILPLRLRTNLTRPVASQHDDRHHVSGDSHNAQRTDDDGVEYENVELTVNNGRSALVNAGQREVFVDRGVPYRVHGGD